MIAPAPTYGFGGVSSDGALSGRFGETYYAIMVRRFTWVDNSGCRDSPQSIWSIEHFLSRQGIYGRHWVI